MTIKKKQRKPLGIFINIPSTLPPLPSAWHDLTEPMFCHKEITCRECLEAESEIHRMPGDMFICPFKGEKANKGIDHKKAFEIVCDMIKYYHVPCSICPAQNSTHCRGDMRYCNADIKSFILSECETVEVNHG
ncbi:MAG: hypothetical protein A2020_16455 [Lentisphaerae bacterium GWF2_45_14]|nr:MAG: hypothetical protein A2020_16455 [Lentisphaerae bacterium GWF2_45_14]